MPETTVLLILSDGSKAWTRVPTNRHGQLPAVIVDPRDDQGCVISGTWLGDSRDGRMDGSVYESVQATSNRSFARAAGRASGWPPAHF
jgi:hypothetical protein